MGMGRKTGEDKVGFSVNPGIVLSISAPPFAILAFSTVSGLILSG